ncbi:MAG: antibiotic biosynthesis monooxygenase [Anaerolineae bacterium]|nr:antibiotic biosynthesis monooxygenase [Anaerolineae bacterium]
MYGTIAKMRVKAGAEQAFMRVAAETESVPVAGVVAVYIYQMDADSRDFYMTVMFDSQESYVANANSPEQHNRFMQLMAVLETEPEWHDGTVVFANT